MQAVGDIHIGTSGWHYDHWKGAFYPQDMLKKDYLAYYSRHLRTVEINNSFYQLPQTTTLEKWRDGSPGGFIFSVKGSRYTTHMKKLKDPHQSVPKLLDRVGVLGEKLGPILYQLPPNWRFNGERLNRFLSSLPQDFRFALECRDPAWFNDKTYELLKTHGAAFCIFDLDGRTSPKKVTADFVYARLHGPGGPYKGSYSTKALSGWAGAFSAWAAQGKDIFCYFDNDENGYAAQNALQLKDMMATAP